MKLYAEYIKERHGKELYVMENIGFASYSIETDHSTAALYIYVYDMHVTPIFRGGKVAISMVDDLYQIAKEKGCKFAITTVDLDSGGAIRALQFQLKVGMVPIALKDNLMTLKRDI